MAHDPQVKTSGAFPVCVVSSAHPDMSAAKIVARPATKRILDSHVNFIDTPFDFDCLTATPRKHLNPKPVVV